MMRQYKNDFLNNINFVKTHKKSLFFIFNLKTEILISLLQLIHNLVIKLII